jgi:hypothetical protein
VRWARNLLPILAALLVSGCWWQGPVFYPPDPAAAQPFAPGLYQMTDSDGKVQQARIVRNADGSLGPAPDGDHKNVGKLFFVPLALTGRHVWISELISTDPATPGAIYGLVESRDDGVAHNLLIDCESNADLVRAAGGVVEQQGDGSKGDGPKGEGMSCRFNDAASLEKALSAYAQAHPTLDNDVNLKRIGD